MIVKSLRNANILIIRILKVVPTSTQVGRENTCMHQAMVMCSLKSLPTLPVGESIALD